MYCDGPYSLGAVGIDDAAIFVATELISGALARKAHKKAKQRAWKDALARIPEDDLVDYAAYVDSQDDLLKAWQTGSWLPARGATKAQFGLINIREFGPRDGVPIKVLPPGKRPSEGPTNGFAASYPVSVLRAMPPLSSIVPKVEGVNYNTPKTAATGTTNTKAVTRIASIPIAYFVGAGVLAVFLLSRST